MWVGEPLTVRVHQRAARRAGPALLGRASTPTRQASAGAGAGCGVRDAGSQSAKHEAYCNCASCTVAICNRDARPTSRAPRPASHIPPLF